LFYISKITEDDDILKEIINCLSSKDFDILIPTLRVLGGTMYTPDITVMDRAFQFGIVDLLTNLLNTNNASTISEVCWILSNMVVSSSAFVSNFVEHPVLSKIMTLCQSKSITIKKESLYVLANCVSSADVITLERIL